LYKVQGHSSSGTTEWDWTKFESQNGAGGTGTVAGEVIPNTTCEGNSIPIKAGETQQVPGMWQALPVEAKATIKANVRHLKVYKIEVALVRTCTGNLTCLALLISVSRMCITDGNRWE